MEISLTTAEAKMVVDSLTETANSLLRGNHGSVSEEYSDRYRALANRIREATPTE